MLWNGTVTATVVLSASGDLLMAPQVSQTGLCTDGQTADFVADTSLAIEDAVAEQARPDSDDSAIEQLVRTTVRQMAKSQFRLLLEKDSMAIKALPRPISKILMQLIAHKPIKTKMKKV